MNKKSSFLLLALLMIAASCNRESKEVQELKNEIVALQAVIERYEREQDSVVLAANIVDCNREIRSGDEFILALQVTPKNDLTLSSIEIDGVKLDSDSISGMSNDTWLGPFVNLKFDEPGQHEIILTGYSKYDHAYHGAKHVINVLE